MLTIKLRTPYEMAALEDRCSPRKSIKIKASLRKAGDTGFDVVVKDISLAGFACEAVTSMRAGATCWLTLPGLGSQQSEVIWNDGAMVGCSFANLLHPAVLDRLMAQA